MASMDPPVLENTAAALWFCLPLATLLLTGRFWPVGVRAEMAGQEESPDLEVLAGPVEVLVAAVREVVGLLFCAADHMR